MKSSIVFVFIVYFSSALANLLGDVKGNGGDIVICKNEKNISLDLYELKYRYDLKEKVFANELGIDKAMEIVLQRLHNYSPIRAELYSKWYLSFYEDTIFVEHDISDIQDTGNHVEIPVHCNIKQIINQNSQILVAPKRYIINKNLWEKIDENSKLSLILHEFLYRENPAENSELLRKFNAFLLADKLNELEFFEYIEWIKKLGIISNAIQGVNVNLKKEIVYFDGSGKGVNSKGDSKTFISLKRAYPVDASIYSLHSAQFYLQDAPIEFFKNKSPKSFCFYGKNIWKYKNTEILQYCLNKHMPDTHLHLYENSKAKSFFTDGGTIKNSNYEINLAKSHSNSYMWNSYLEFYENEEVKTVYNSATKIFQQGQVLKLDEKKVEFYNNSVVKSARWKSKVKILILGENRELVSDFEKYEDNTFKSFAFLNVEKIHFLNQEVLLLPNSKITFHSNSKIKSFRIVKDTSLKDINDTLKHFKALDIVQLNEDQSFVK